MLGAPSPSQLESVAPLLKEDVIWDGPPLLLGFVQTKGQLLAGLRLGAALGSWSLEPLGVQVTHGAPHLGRGEEGAGRRGRGVLPLGWQRGARGSLLGDRQSMAS
jgi:hypothetical protein